LTRSAFDDDLFPRGARSQLFAGVDRASEAQRASDRRRISFAVAIVASAVAIDLIVVALWWWQTAGPVGRSGAVAMLAAAQLLLLYGVVGRLMRPSRLDTVLRFMAGLVCVAALGGTVALWLAAR
jgi:hypothetical protein